MTRHPLGLHSGGASRGCPRLRQGLALPNPGTRGERGPRARCHLLLGRVHRFTAGTKIFQHTLRNTHRPRQEPRCRASQCLEDQTHLPREGVGLEDHLMPPHGPEGANTGGRQKPEDPRAHGAWRCTGSEVQGAGEGGRGAPEHEPDQGSEEGPSDAHRDALVPPGKVRTMGKPGVLPGPSHQQMTAKGKPITPGTSGLRERAGWRTQPI